MKLFGKKKRLDPSVVGIAAVVLLVPATLAFDDQAPALLAFTAIAALTVVWIPLLVGASVMRLGRLEWREELSLTFLDVQSYLKRRLGYPMWRAATPYLLSHALLIRYPFDEFTLLEFMGVAGLVLVAIACVAASALGCVLWLKRILSESSTQQSILFPAIWTASVFACLLPLRVIASTLGWLAVVPLILFGPILIVMLLREHWRQLELLYPNVVDHSAPRPNFRP